MLDRIWHSPGLVFCAVVWALLTFLQCQFETRLPSTDVFLFKEAGVRLATEGKFVASDLPHVKPGVDFVYAYYPPLYPLMYGVWSRVTGVSLRSSILFDNLLRALRTLFVGLLIIQFWQGGLSRNSKSFLRYRLSVLR